MKLSVYLVGSNPLPVMIALSYDFKLVQEFDKVKAKNKNPDTVLFVCSGDTENYCDNIKQWMRKKQINVEIKYKKVSEAHYSLSMYNEIKKEVMDILNLQNDIKEIFINVTSGTKTMATNAILALIDVAGDRDISLIEADIDPEKGCINLYDPIAKTDKGHFPYDITIAEAFGDVITISDIMEAYDYRLKRENDKGFILEDQQKTIEFAQKILANDKAYTLFQAIVFGLKSLYDFRKKLTNNEKNSESMILKEETLNNFLLDVFNLDLKDNGAKKGIDLGLIKKINAKKINKDEKLFPFIYSIDDELKTLCDDFKEYGLLTENNGVYSMKKEAYEFVTGKWFEEYIWALIRELTDGKIQFEVKQSCEIYPKDAKDGSKFEIDVVVRNGFDIYFISCTTDTTKHLSNTKIREVLANSESIGLRTKVIFVSMYNEDSSEFQQRYNAFSSRKYKNIKYITIVDMKNINVLKKRLADILNIKKTGDLI